jgi:SAM-dependent methyltransferase
MRGCAFAMLGGMDTGSARRSMPPGSDRRALLERALAVLRLPDAPDAPPELVEGGAGLRSPASGRIFRLEGGVLDLLDERFDPTTTQKLLDAAPIAWLYDAIRPRLASWFGMPAFAEEAGDVARRLELQPGDTVVDVACGHGNFTVEIARQVGPEGLVVGIDIADAMLRRAVRHVGEAGLGNVLLVRGDALALPLATGSVAKLNCSGGLHQLPDLPRALREFARATRPGGRFAGSGFASAPGDRLGAWKRWSRERFAMHFVEMGWLRAELETAGYQEVESALPSTWVGYAWGRRAAEAI